MTSLNEKNLIALAERVLEEARRVSNATRNCLNCDEFNEDTEHCTPAVARPPARVIAFGCELWSPKIPF